MKRLIYDLYYADEITVEVAEKLLDKLNKYLEKKRDINMSKRNARNKQKLEKLNEINYIDKRLKKNKVKDNQEVFNKLLSRRNTLRTQLKTN